MKRLGQAARHMSNEARKAISDAQKARWAKARNDVNMKKEQKASERITSQVSDVLYIQLQKENELLRAEVSFYRNMCLNSDKKAA